MADLGDVSRSIPQSVPIGALAAWPHDQSGTIVSSAPPAQNLIRRPTLALVGGGSVVLDSEGSLTLSTVFNVLDRQAPVAGKVRFYHLEDDIYFVQSWARDVSWRVDVQGGVATVTPILAARYPTVPIGNRLLVMAGGKIKAIFPG